MKNPFFASRPPHVDDAGRKSVEEILTETGLNTGNMLFFSASRRAIKHEKPSSGMAFKPDYVRANHDGIVIPAANWLTGRRDLTNMAELIERADLPTVVLGLGAQSFQAEVPEMMPGTIRFLKAISDRSHSLSVRGNYTAEVVNKAGIKNVTVTGCPSLLWRVTEPTSVTKAEGPISAISVHGTRYDEKLMFKQQTKSEIGLVMMRHARKHDLDFVAQTEKLEMQFARGELTAEQNPEELTYLGRVYKDRNADTMSAYLKDHVKFFCSVQDWVAYFKTRQLSIGTRLHGAIAALLAGTPGIVVTHDSRTVEMTIQAGIPHVSMEQVLSEGLDVQGLYAAADFDHFNSVQRSYYQNFLEFFRANGIETHLVDQQSLPVSA